MATQSEIQSLLQSLTGLQSNIQGASPFTANNGNPNTVYNLSAPNVQQFNPATGNLPAMGDARGNWAVPAGGTIGGIDPALLALLQQLASVNRTQVNATIPPLTLKPVVPGAPGQAGNPQPPPQNPDLSNTQQQILNDLMGTGPIPDVGGGGGMGGGNSGLGLSNGVGNFGSTGGANTGNSSGGFYDNATGMWGSNPATANKLGFNRDGSMDWKQIADLFLPGNLYNSQTKEWNQGNILGSIANQLLGISGIGGLINKIGEHQTNDSNPNNDNSWFVKQFLGNVQNRAEGLDNQLLAMFQNQFAKDNNPLEEKLFDIWSDKNQQVVDKLTNSANDKMESALADALGLDGPGGYDFGGGGDGGGSIGNFGDPGGGLSGIAGSYGGAGGGALGLGTGIFGGSGGIFGGSSSGNFGGGGSGLTSIPMKEILQSVTR